MIQEAIEKLMVKENLTELEATHIMEGIIESKFSSAQIGGFLTALRAKGETKEEIVGLVKVIRARSTKVNTKGIYAIDTCGTGGDKSNTFNVSTAVAFVAAAAGVKVIKHGNRSVTSRCGSADVLEELGIDISMDSVSANHFLLKHSFCFLFAPKYHTAMGNVVKIRKDLGVRTVFNILGPLTNPGRVQGQVLGVSSEKLTGLIGETLRDLGTERAMVVHGLDGLDEITTSTLTKVAELGDGHIKEYFINPKDYGINLSKKEDVTGGLPQENGKILRCVLKGVEGPKLDMVLLNGGAALYVGKKVNSLAEGVKLAREVISKGLASAKLEDIIRDSGRLKENAG